MHWNDLYNAKIGLRSINTQDKLQFSDKQLQARHNTLVGILSTPKQISFTKAANDDYGLESQAWFFVIKYFINTKANFNSKHDAQSKKEIHMESDADRSSHRLTMSQVSSATCTGLLNILRYISTCT